MIEINFLPWRTQLNEKNKQQTLMMFVVVIVTGIAIIILWHYLLTLKIQIENEKNHDMQSVLIQQARQLAEIKMLTTEQSEVESKLYLINNLKRSRQQIMNLLNDINHSIPPGIYLQEIKKLGDQVIVIGKTQDENKISTMIKFLEKKSNFKQVTIQEFKLGIEKQNQQYQKQFIVRLMLPKVKESSEVYLE